VADPGNASRQVTGLGGRSVSIRDVAAAAGVSYQTVSRVINGHPSVKDSTRTAVLDVIARLGFRPNRAARALAGGPAQAVTVLTSNTTLYGYAAALQGIEEAGRAAGFTVAVRVIESDTPAAIRDAITRAVEPGGTLIVIAFDRAGTRALAAVPPGVPMAAAVATPADGDAHGCPWVWIDDRRAAYDTTRYLLGLGHRTVHYVSIPPTTDDLPQRLVGWRSALEEARVAVPEPIQAGWHPRSGYDTGRTLAADPTVTAVLCGNDDLALGVLRAMHEAGRAVPGSVSVAGFDDTPLSEFYTPALTTVRQDFAELGRACFDLLRQRMGAEVAARPAPEPVLVIRESTGPPLSPSAGPAPRSPSCA
jgi:DNA-binding LacI/PurR family transcriptional regulator